MWLNSCCCPTKEEQGVMAGSGSEACSDSPASSREERKMAKRQVEEVRRLQRQDSKKQEKVNKQIDKQLKKDKKKYKSTHRLQLVGPAGSGKSTLITQMRLLYENDTVTDGVRLGRKGEILVTVRDALECVLVAMPGLELCVSSGENELHRSWILEEASVRRAAKAAAEEAESPARVRSPTLSRRLSLQTPFEPGDKFFAAARALWADAAVRGCFDKINPCTFDKKSARYFLDKLDQLSTPDYVPGDSDLLHCYVPTLGLFECNVHHDNITFRLFECNEDQTGNKWMQYATDVVAVIFVADASAYDVVKCNGVDAATGEEIYSNKLLETLDSFKKMWVNPLLKKKSVILLLNKQDQLEEKISSPLHPGLEKFFPKYELYQLSEAHREEAVSAATSPDAVNTEYLRAKYFIRDLFLGASLHCGAEHSRSLDHDHHVYPHFTCAFDTAEVGRVINNCCRDILQRMHLRMHEIL